MSKEFEKFELNKQLLNAIEEMGYSKPTPIQEKGIPPMMNGQDLMGVAQTGTGKTAAYVIPLVMKLKYAQGMDPRALILSPTRELAIQIHENIQALAKYTDLRSAVLYGGLGPKTQKEILSKGIDIVVATPGRLVELYLSGDLILKDFAQWHPSYLQMIHSIALQHLQDHCLHFGRDYTNELHEQSCCKRRSLAM